MQLVLLEGQADKPQKNQDAELTLPPTTWFKAVGPLAFVRAGEMIRPGPELPRCWYQNLAESASISAGAGPGYGWSRVRTMVRPSHHRQRPGVELAEGAEQTGGHSWRLSIHSIAAIQRRRRFWRWSLMRCAWGKLCPIFSSFFCWTSKQRCFGAPRIRARRSYSERNRTAHVMQRNRGDKCE